MKTITTNHLLELLLTTNFNGATFVSFDSLTDVKLSGGMKNQMQGRIQKLTLNSNVIIFQNKNSNGYENMVNKRLKQENLNPATFELSPRTWGKRIEGTPVIEHKGAHYLEVIFIRSGSSSYLFDGKDINKNDVIGLEAPAMNSEGQGGLNNKVIIRTFKLSSIKRITINKETYLVV